MQKVFDITSMTRIYEYDEIFEFWNFGKDETKPFKIKRTISMQQKIKLNFRCSVSLKSFMEY